MDSRKTFIVITILILGLAVFWLSRPPASVEKTPLPQMAENLIRNKANLSLREGKSVAESNRTDLLPAETKFVIPENVEDLRVEVYDLAGGGKKYLAYFRLPTDLYHAYLSSLPVPGKDIGWEQSQAARTEYSALRELSNASFVVKIVYIADGEERTRVELEIKTK